MAGTNQENERPLMVAISGGAGCLSSINALASQMQAADIDMPVHAPVLNKDKIDDWQARGIRLASFIMNAPILNDLVAVTNFPVFPNIESIEKEIASIEAGQKENRLYIDLLLDVVDSGHIIAAMYNIRSKQTDAAQSRKLVDLQKLFEQLQYSKVKSYFLKKLHDAEQEGNPYTKIVTTQMVCIDAICAAVLAYNAEMPKEKHIHVHQYMSDIFTPESQHYVKPLKCLSKETRSILHLYGVNVKDIADDLLMTEMQGEFASIEEIDYLDNPMVRQGFKEANLGQYKIAATEIQQLPVQNEQGDDTLVEIQPEEKVVSIMLSSVGGESTVNYTEMLSRLYTDKKPDYDKIFVFCGRNQALKKQLEQEIMRLQGREAFLGMEKTSEIILLGHQDAEHIANIFTRSDLTILRGGFVLMEEMALGLNHSSEQRYFFPHLKDTKGNLTTGIPWEDASINYFIQHLEEQHNLAWAKKGEVSDLRLELKPEWSILDELDSYSQELNGATPELKEALSVFLEQLKLDIVKQNDENVPEEAIRESEAFKLAIETMKYVDKLSYLLNIDESSKEDKKAKLIELIQEYDGICYPIANASLFMRYVIKVIAISIGFVTGFFIGACIAAWTGPGALVTGLLLAVACASGAASSNLVSNSLFKATPIIEKNRRDFVDAIYDDLKEPVDDMIERPGI